MPGGRKVGEVYYEVTADNQVARGLAAAEGQIDAFKAKVDATDARIEVEADLKGLEKDLAEAKAMGEALDGERIQMEVEIKDLEKVQELGDLTDEQSKRYKQLTKEIDRGNGVRETELDNIKRSIQLNRTNQRVIGQGITQRRQELRDIKSAERSINNLGDSIDHLGEKYARLYTQREKIDRQDPFRRTRREQIVINRLNSDLDRLGNAIRRAGGDTRDFEVDLDRNNHTLGSWVRSIAETRVHMGFFSTTLKGLGIILLTLGPVILSVLGAAGALVGVVGAGIAGATAVGIAGLTGFGLAALGAGIALKPAIADMSAAFKATKALSDAQLKYGKDSSQAKDKQEQLNNTLKGMDPAARQAFQSLAGMRTQFDKLAGRGIRRDFFQSFGEGIKTAKALLPTFATESRKTFHAASEGVNEWFRALRSPEGKQALADIMGNFRKSLPDLLHGFGALGAMFGHIAQSASTFLPMLTKGFDKWATGLKDSVGSGDQLTERIGRLVHAMQQVGHFAQAAGGALTTFFGIGAGAGGNLLDAMTRSLDRWNEHMKRSPEGTREFFQQSVDTIKQLGPAVGKALVTIANLSMAFAPAIQGASTALNALATVMEGISNIPLGHQLLAAAGAVYVLNRALSALAVTGLFGGAAAAAGGGAGGLLGRIFGRGGASAVAAETAAVTTEMAGMEAASVAAAGGLAGTGAAMGGAEVAAGGLAAALPPVAITLGAIVGVGLVANAVMGDGTDAWKGARDAARAFGSSTAALPGAIRAASNAQQKSNDSWARYNKLVKAGKGDTKAALEAIRETARADNDAVDAQQKRQFETRKQRNALTSLNAEYAKQKKVLDGMEVNNQNDLDARNKQAQSVAQLAAQLRLATLNYNRLKAGAAAAGPEMLKSLSAIKQLAGRQTALKFRFSDQDVTRGIARVSSKLAAAGRKGQVIKILADSKNAEQAFARLKALMNKVPNSKQIHADAHDAASSKLQHIKANIAALKDKVVAMKANDAASGKIRAVQAAIAALHDKSVTITTNHVDNFIRRHSGVAPGWGGYAGGVVPRGLATGGMNDRTMEKAYEDAARRAGLRAERGARVNSPRYVVGEQGPTYTEFVITDNPAFRRSNAAYLEQAAAALGYYAVPGFGKGGSIGKKMNKARDKLSKSAKKDPVGATADWNRLQDELDFWSEEYDLDRRSYDSGIGGGGTMSEGGPSLLGQMDFDLANQIGIYQSMIPLVNRVASTDKISKVPGHFKKDKKQKKLDKLNERIDTWNSAVDEAKGTIMSERDIKHAIQALELERLEIQNAAANNQLLGTSSANLANFNVMRDFASNITGAALIPSLGPGGLGSGATVPALSPAVATRAAVATGGGGVNTEITVNNSFTEPPSDPLTWTEGLAFELTAMTT